MSDRLFGKRILIIDPTGQKNYKVSLLYPIKEQLENLGAKVKVLNISQSTPFQNNHFPDKLRNIYRRIVHKDIYYYRYLESKHFSKYCIKEFRKQIKDEKFDYTFILRPDMFTDTFVKLVRKNTDFLASYMWTAVKKGTLINLQKNRKYFDKAFNFDPDEISKYSDLNWELATNFHYNFPKISQQKVYDILYFGAIYTNRRDLIAYNLFKNLSDSFNIKVFIGEINPDKIELIEDQRVEYIDEQIPYFDYVFESSKAKILLDIAKPEHKGLSFRFFECISLETKLITNNTDVVNYDFYEPENIYIIDFDNANYEELKKFIDTPYKKLPLEIYQKYSFENWIQYIFGIPGHSPICYNTEKV